MNKILKSLANARTLAVFLLAISFLLGSVVFASSNISPTFPSCESKIFTSNGDWAHYSSGLHGIVGVGNLSGRDDVYSLGDGNFLQCFCPTDGSTGIQSNWWDAQRAGLTQSEMTSYQSQGWFKENGSGWNLYNETYLIKNQNFSCVQPSVTPTPVFSVTPTPGQGGRESFCSRIEAVPSEGSAPLTVKFIAHADDPVTNGKLKEYKFDFGDASGGQPQVFSQTETTAYHRYDLSGEYTAKVDVQDQAGNWRGSDACRVKIKVSSVPQVLGASTPSSLPTTGLEVVIVVSLLPLGVIGYKLYRRFRLV